MAAEITIRSERPGDAAAVADVVRRAYADVGYSDHREHLMVERLRGTTAFIPALSLLAEIGGEMVGHVLLTKARIGTAETLALAPLSVTPERQSQGVGTALVRTAHRTAADLGFGSVVLVGVPRYYRRFGYEPLGGYPIDLPFDAPDANRMILALAPGALDGASGTVRYADGWLDH